MKSDVVKAAIILGASVVLAAGVLVYFSPYHSSVRAFHSADDFKALDVAAKCAQLTSQ